MKKSFLALVALSFLLSYPLESQGLLNKVKKAVTKEISGTTEDDSSNDPSKPGPEPACACDDASLVLDLTKYKIEYNEFTVCSKDDGSMLVFDKIGSKYYIIKNRVAEGPYKEGDPRIQGFCSGRNKSESDENADAWVTKYPGIVSRSGEKYLIKFGGKNYGPFGMINDFAVSKTRNKFAAIVTENLMMTEDQGKKMEEAMENAKTDQERMDITMKMSQQMQNQMMQGGGPASMQPKLISNIPGATYDMVTWMGGRLNGSVKFNDIIVIAPDRIMDMTGKTVIKISQNSYNTDGMFVNSSNTKYASYNYGALTFSDNTTLAEVFNPNLIETGGKVFLAYMYYSPGKNAIMQCSIPF
jgi:hypothetical protein